MSSVVRYFFILNFAAALAERYVLCAAKVKLKEIKTNKVWLLKFNL